MESVGSMIRDIVHSTLVDIMTFRTHAGPLDQGSHLDDDTSPSTYVSSIPSLSGEQGTSLHQVPSPQYRFSAPSSPLTLGSPSSRQVDHAQGSIRPFPAVFLQSFLARLSHEVRHRGVEGGVSLLAIGHPAQRHPLDRLDRLDHPARDDRHPFQHYAIRDRRRHREGTGRGPADPILRQTPSPEASSRASPSCRGRPQASSRRRFGGAPGHQRSHAGGTFVPNFVPDIDPIPRACRTEEFVV
jgi:hypothetical protein